MIRTLRRYGPWRSFVSVSEAVTAQVADEYQLPRRDVLLLWSLRGLLVREHRGRVGVGVPLRDHRLSQIYDYAMAAAHALTRDVEPDLQAPLTLVISMLIVGRLYDADLARALGHEFALKRARRKSEPLANEVLKCLIAWTRDSLPLETGEDLRACLRVAKEIDLTDQVLLDFHGVNPKDALIHLQNQLEGRP